MRKKGFSIIEVLMGIVLIGVIAVAFFPVMTSGLTRMKQTKKFTEQTFAFQTEVENAILTLNESKGTSAAWPATSEISLFGKKVKTKVARLSTTGGEHRELLIALPEKRDLRPELPEINSVKLEGKNGEFKGEVGLKNEAGVEFCIYRWYIGDLSKIGADWNKESVFPLVLLREYNQVRNNGDAPRFEKKLHFKNVLQAEVEFYDNVEYKLIGGHKSFARIEGTPNSRRKSETTAKTRDVFWVNSLNLQKDSEDLNKDNFTDLEMKLLYANKGLVFSAIPVGKDGRVGREVYSTMMDLGIHNKILIGMHIPNMDGDVYEPSFIAKFWKAEQKNIKVEFFEKRDSKTYVPIGQKQESVTNELGVFPFVGVLEKKKEYKVTVTIDGKSVDGIISALDDGSKMTDRFYFTDVKDPYFVHEDAEMSILCLDKSAKPVSGVTVEYSWKKSDSSTFLGRKKGKTKKDGKVEIETSDLPEPGKYTIYASAVVDGEVLDATKEIEAIYPYRMAISNFRYNKGGSILQQGYSFTVDIAKHPNSDADGDDLICETKIILKKGGSEYILTASDSPQGTSARTIVVPSSYVPPFDEYVVQITLKDDDDDDEEVGFVEQSFTLSPTL